MIHDIVSFLQKAPGIPKTLDKILSACFKGYLSEMDKTLQSAVHHAEGSVLTHTKMVCDALDGMDEFHSLAPMQMTAVSFAALLHDIGKIKSTRLLNGEWVSSGHSLTGAHLTREILWKQFGLCGTTEKATLRETVCLLVRYHSTPVYVHNHPTPESHLAKIASNGLLAPLFTLKLMCLLAEANARGRVSSETETHLERINACRNLAESQGILEGPSAESAQGNRDSSPAAESMRKGKHVIMLCGLPGSGKDTWIKENAPHLPLISTDAMRRKLNIPKGEKSNVVSRAAQEEARSILLSGRSLVWNATNLTEITRMRLIHQFESYGADVEIVYLETDWQKTLMRNSEKPESVPIPILEEMLSKLTPPERFEASGVRWVFG